MELRRPDLHLLVRARPRRHQLAGRTGHAFWRPAPQSLGRQPHLAGGASPGGSHVGVANLLAAPCHRPRLRPRPPSLPPDPSCPAALIIARRPLPHFRLSPPASSVLPCAKQILLGFRY